MKHLLLSLAAALSLAACSPTTPAPVSAGTLAQPVPVTVTTNAQIALDSYKAALGVAQVALRGNPALLVRINALADKAAPYIALAQAGVVQAGTAPSLSALAAELLVEAAPYIIVMNRN